MARLASQPPRVLFITYDGMTDPLGQSQVLPYLVGLARRGYAVTLLSTEKPARLAAHRATIEAIVAAAGIRWEFITFTSRPPIVAKVYDQYRLRRAALQLHAAQPFDLVHCRSYVAAGIGLVLRQRGVKFLFDMRGFWVDERVEGGLWDLRQPFYRALYRHYKRREAAFIAQADGIVSLTEAGAAEIRTWPAYHGAPIVVIPCSADFATFRPSSAAERRQVREQLGLAPEALVVSYLGSLGTWYLLPDMLRQFAVIKRQYPGARLLFVTQDPAATIEQAAAAVAGLAPDDLLIRSARRQEVTALVGASDVNLFFIKPSYSKKASSPTKLGEVLAMGLPVICNAGVGDVAAIIRQTAGGIALDELTEPEFARAARALPALLAQDPAQRRARARQYYDLNNAIAQYARQYEALLGPAGLAGATPAAAANSNLENFTTTAAGVGS